MNNLEDSIVARKVVRAQVGYELVQEPCPLFREVGLGHDGDRLADLDLQRGTGAEPFDVCGHDDLFQAIALAFADRDFCLVSLIKLTVSASGNAQGIEKESRFVSSTPLRRPHRALETNTHLPVALDPVLEVDCSTEPDTVVRCVVADKSKCKLPKPWLLLESAYLLLCRIPHLEIGHERLLDQLIHRFFWGSLSLFFLESWQTRRDFEIAKVELSVA
jgi:hypothetical protein